MSELRFPTMSAARLHFRSHHNPFTEECVTYKVDFGYKYKVRMKPVPPAIEEKKVVDKKPRSKLKDVTSKAVVLDLPDKIAALDKLITKHVNCKRITPKRHQGLLAKLHDMKEEEQLWVEVYGWNKESETLMDQIDNQRRAMTRLFSEQKKKSKE